MSVICGNTGRRQELECINCDCCPATSPSPSRAALETALQSVAAALERAGVTDCDDPGEAIDVLVADLRAAAVPGSTVLTCVYCGHQYPDGTPAAKHNLLTEHIKVCEQHPLRQAELQIQKLKTALAAMIGADSKAELDAMELAIRAATAPDSDKAVIINAIDVLRACIQETSPT